MMFHERRIPVPLPHNFRRRPNTRDSDWIHGIFTLLGLVGCFYLLLVFLQISWLQQMDEGSDGTIVSTSTPVMRGTKETVAVSDGKSDSGNTSEPAVLVFRFPYSSHQGTGNIMNGFLAAQMLAEEFGRVLCHARAETTSFSRAFEWIDPSHQELCDRILAEGDGEKDSNTINVNNYDQTSESSECDMRELLSNHNDFPIVYYSGNSYPRWPSKAVSSPRDYFHEKFKPTQALKEVLPWKPSDPPPIVVHLRKGDNGGDQRNFDDETLSLLATGDFLDDSDSKKTVFLVTNNVEWYSRFPEWSHPEWSSIRHSALKKISWGEAPDPGHGTPSTEEKGDGILQMWADWYTLVKAQKIYHTFSDFSLSAVRWNQNIKSWTIAKSRDTTSVTQRGNRDASSFLKNDATDLYSSNESQGGISRLVDRTTRELWFCGNPSPEEEMATNAKHEARLRELEEDYEILHRAEERRYALNRLHAHRKQGKRREACVLCHA